MPIDIGQLNIDIMTASAHKMYGPKGVGLLFLKRGIKIDPLLHGGGQESNMRSATLNIPGIVGFAKACEISLKEMGDDDKRISQLRDKLLNEIMKIEGVELNGHPRKRLSNNINVRFSCLEGESLVLQLDIFGIAVSTGSACSSHKLQPSYVLMATGIRQQEAHGSLRISLGKWTTEEEIDYFITILPEAV